MESIWESQSTVREWSTIGHLRVISLENKRNEKRKIKSERKEETKIENFENLRWDSHNLIAKNTESYHSDNNFKICIFIGKEKISCHGYLNNLNIFKTRMSLITIIIPIISHTTLHQSRRWVLMVIKNCVAPLLFSKLCLYSS